MIKTKTVEIATTRNIHNFLQNNEKLSGFEGRLNVKTIFQLKWPSIYIFSSRYVYQGH